jgi:hypothetical protein
MTSLSIQFNPKFDLSCRFSSAEVIGSDGPGHKVGEAIVAAFGNWLHMVECRSEAACLQYRQRY